jgi:hypothetical protein
VPRKLTRSTRSARATDRNAVKTSADNHATQTSHGMGGPLKEGADSPLASQDTPEQQAATTDALNGWNRERVLEAIAVTGTIEEAALVANVSPWAIHQWQRSDPTFAERLAVARRRAGERVVGKVYRAVMAADPEQLVRTPTSAMFLVNGLLPEWRPNGSPAVQVNVQVNNDLSSAQVEAVARALAGIPEGEPVP